MKQCKFRMKQCKLRADEEWGVRVTENYKGNKKLFWKDVNGVRKKEEGMEVKVNDANGVIMVEEEKVQRRWTEYFERLLNVDEGREAGI